MDDRLLRDRIELRLETLDARRWFRRALLITAVSGATGGVHALDAGTAVKTSADAAVQEDARVDDDDYAVPMYGVDIGPGCGGA